MKQENFEAAINAIEHGISVTCFGQDITKEQNDFLRDKFNGTEIVIDNGRSLCFAHPCGLGAIHFFTEEDYRTNDEKDQRRETLLKELAELDGEE